MTHSPVVRRIRGLALFAAISAAALASVALFVGMIAIWAQFLAAGL